VANPNGITSRTQTRNSGTAGYFAFWLIFSRSLPGNNTIGYVSSPNGLGNGMYLNYYNGNLYWTGEILAYVSGVGPGVGLTTRIELGAQPVGAWVHYALQISAGTTGPGGTQVVSAWRNGVPVTEFRTGQPQNTLQTGSTWNGKNYIDRVQGWTWGAPYPQGPVTAENLLDFYVDDIVVRTDAPYTNLQSFTPEPITWGGNVTQMVTGI
jgi:hypothetical protein